MGSGFSRQKKQAKMLQEQMRQFQEQIKNIEAIGTAGNGLVTVVLTGESQMKSITIKPECVDPEDIEGLEDLIRVAYNEAQKKVQQQMPSMPGGLPF